MFLLNLTWLQLFAVAAGISAGVVALYLWDRSKRRITVPTLRFWQSSGQAAEVRHRRRIQQPLSLLLQLAAAALLLLALAQPRLGTPGPVSRDHVLLLDTSAWMAARSGQATLMDEARAAARAYVRALPAGDRVMLVRADALSTPVTAFEQDRAATERAIDDTRAGATALNLGQAVEFARQARKLQGGAPGEIVYAGAARTLDPPALGDNAAGLRVLPVHDPAPNCGLRRIGVQRSTSDLDVWEILVAVRNYGPEPRSASVTLSFSGSPAGSRKLMLPALGELNVPFQFRTRSVGVLEARLFADDTFPQDDHAALELPGQKPLNVVVYSDEPESLKAVLTSNPLVNAVFRPTVEYRPGETADVLLFDRFNPPARPASDSIWIEPPAGSAPVPVRTTVADATVKHWRPDHPLSAGIRALDLRLASAQVFAPDPDDTAIAEVEAGPVIVARAGSPKLVVLGFHPTRGGLRYELTTPLLFANVLRWMAPDIFRRWEVHAGSPGAVNVDLGQEAAAAGVRVIDAKGSELPYTVDEHTLRFFAGEPGTVRVIAGDREMVYSLTLPELADTRWTPPAAARRGVPHFASEPVSFIELWPWLALAGGLALALEWVLFGLPRFRVPRMRRPQRAAS